MAYTRRLHSELWCFSASFRVCICVFTSYLRGAF